MLTILTTGTAYALPLSNPAESTLFTDGIFCKSLGGCDMRDPCFSFWQAWSVRVGFYGDYVFNRHMTVATAGHPNIDCTQVFTNAGYLVFNICNRVDLFATLGATNIQFHNSLKAFPNNGATQIDREQNIAVFFDPAFSWSIGGRANILHIGCFSVGVEGQYFRTNPDYNYVLSGRDGLQTYIDDQSAVYHEWQVGIGAAYCFEVCSPEISIIPYVGTSWSDAHLDTGNFQLTLTPDPTVTFLGLQTQKRWAYIVGGTLTLYEMIGVTVEGRFGSEKALYAMGEFRF